MSTGQLRTARSLAAAAKLEKLDVLTPWTEEANQESTGANTEPAKAPTAKEPATTRSRGRPPKNRQYVSPAQDDPDLPWAHFPQPAAMKTMTVRLPMEMYQELKWYGETTRQSSLHQQPKPVPTPSRPGCCRRQQHTGCGIRRRRTSWMQGCHSWWCATTCGMRRCRPQNATCTWSRIGSMRRRRSTGSGQG